MIRRSIREYRSDKEVNQKLNDLDQVSNANDLIDEIKIRIEALEGERKTILAPMEAVSQLVTKFFQNSGISFGPRLKIGEAATAVNSELLSAGEKQLLSFICYNAFYSNTIVFIDEPELSLHVDWQRILFSVLLKQGSNNQFVIATHSPFIYSRYPEKEVCIDPENDRGGELDSRFSLDL